MTKINHRHVAKKLSLGAMALLLATAALTGVASAETSQPFLSVAFNYSPAPSSNFPAGFTTISGTIGSYAPMPEGITGTDSKTYTVGVTSGAGGGIVVRDPKFSGTPVNKGDFTYASLYNNQAYTTGTSMVLSIAGVTPNTTYTITLFAWDLIAHSNLYTATFAAVAPTSGAGGTVTESPGVPPTSNLQYSTTFDVTSTTSQLNISITGNVAPAFFNGFTLAVRGDKPTPKTTGADNSVILPPPTPPAGTPVAVFAVPRLGQLAQFFDHVRKARLGPVDLIFDGDSITEWWQEVAYDLWQQRYGALNAIDFGETADASDQTQHLLWRLNHGELDGLHPKLIVVMIGSHNIGSGTPDEIAAGIKAIIDTYRKDCPDSHILLLGLFPRANSPTDAIRLTIKQINGIISKYDDGKHVTYLDIGDKFLQPDGTLSTDIMPDFQHLSEKGYHIWADAIQPVIDQYVPKTALSPPGAPSPAITSTEPALSWPFPLNPPAGMSSAIFPVPPDDWIDRFAGNLDKLKQGPYDLVFDGDSITDFWQAAGANVLKERFGSFKVLDLGIGGDQVQHALWRLRNSDFTGWNPKLIMLLIGSNNVGQDPKDVAAGVKLMVDEYETRCPNSHLLLMGLFPRDAQPNTPNRNWIKAVNAIISTYGSDPRVTYMDIGDKFLQPDGTLSTDIMPDFLHPSPKGYAIWADAIQPVIDKYCRAPSAAAPASPK